MAIKGVNLSQVHVFSWDKDPDKGTEKAAKFRLKMLDGYQVAYINDLLMGFEQLGKEGHQSAKVNMGRVALEAAQMALTEAENFIDEKNMPITLTKVRKNINGRSYMVVEDKVMAVLPSMLLQDMYQFIQEQNGMVEAEGKKSATP